MQNTILILLSNFCIEKHISTEERLQWKIELSLLKSEINPIEPLPIKIKLKKRFSKFRIPLENEKYYLQIRDSNTREWSNIGSYGFMTGNYQLSEPPLIFVGRGKTYEEILALTSWKYYVAKTDNTSFKDMWYYSTLGKYELRLVFEIDEKKKIYSEAHTFNVVHKTSSDKELIEYLSGLAYPQFLFDYYAFPNQIDTAINIISKYKNADLSKWPKFYILDHMVSERTYYNKNKALATELIQELEKAEKDEFFQRKLEFIKNRLNYK